MKLLLIVFISLQLLDFFLTFLLIRKGNGYEANPIIAKVFSRVKFVEGLCFIKLPILPIGVFASNFPQGFNVLLVLNIIYVFISLNNCRVLLK